jgi:hypothetical protein
MTEGRSQPEWLDMKALQRYACVSERTLRGWIHRATNPLPAVQVGTKLLVRRSTFDQSPVPTCSIVTLNGIHLGRKEEWRIHEREWTLTELDSQRSLSGGRPNVAQGQAAKCVDISW